MIKSIKQLLCQRTNFEDHTVSQMSFRNQERMPLLNRGGITSFPNTNSCFKTRLQDITGFVKTYFWAKWCTASLGKHHVWVYYLSVARYCGLAPLLEDSWYEKPGHVVCLRSRKMLLSQTESWLLAKHCFHDLKCIGGKLNPRRTNSQMVHLR